MTIQWLGSTALKIQTKNGLLLIDPYADTAKQKMPRFKSDVVLTTNPHDVCCNNTQRIQGDPFIVDMPGEYEINDIFIYGAKGGKENDEGNIIYSVKAEGIGLGVLGTLGHDMSKEQISIIENSDVLFVPVHNNPIKRLSTIISIVEPRILIPYYFKSKAFPLDAPDHFLKELGAKDAAEEKLVIKASQLPQEETEIAVLQASA